MSAITPLADDEVPPRVTKTFDRARAAMGKVPNLFRVLAHAPAALDVYTGGQGALSGTAHRVQMFDSTAIRAQVSAAGAKGGKPGRRSAGPAEGSARNSI